MFRSGARTTGIALTSLIRHLPLLCQDSPRTPLRVLCISALDTAHILRYSTPIPRKRVHQLAMFLDFGACTNAAWDRKDVDQVRHNSLRRQLEASGQAAHMEAYLTRLHSLESRRPSIGGNHRRFDEVRAYREGVVRISLATATAIAMNSESIDAELRAIDRDSNFETLFRIVMQCQIVDDVIDYAEDRAAGLPSFLTSVASLQQAIVMTSGAIRAYGGHWERSANPGILPLRIALRMVSTLTSLILHVASAPLLGYSWARERVNNESSRLHSFQWWRARR